MVCRGSRRDHSFPLTSFRSKRSEAARAPKTWSPAQGPWRLDSAESVNWETFEEDDADNLIASGRCNDGDTAALASVRVMGRVSRRARRQLMRWTSVVIRVFTISILHDISDRSKPNLDEFGRDPWTEDFETEQTHVGSTASLPTYNARIHAEAAMYTTAWSQLGMRCG